MPSCGVCSDDIGFECERCLCAVCSDCTTTCDNCDEILCKPCHRAHGGLCDCCEDMPEAEDENGEPKDADRCSAVDCDRSVVFKDGNAGTHRLMCTHCDRVYCNEHLTFERYGRVCARCKESHDAAISEREGAAC